MSQNDVSRMTGRKRKRGKTQARESRRQETDTTIDLQSVLVQELKRKRGKTQARESRSQWTDLTHEFTNQDMGDGEQEYHPEIPNPKRYKTCFPHASDREEKKKLMHKIDVLHAKINSNNMNLFASKNHVIGDELIEWTSDDDSDSESRVPAFRDVDDHEPFTFDLNMTKDEIEDVVAYVWKNMDVIEKCHLVMSAFDEEDYTFRYDSLEEYFRHHTFNGLNTTYPVLRIRDFFHQMKLLSKYGKKSTFGLRVRPTVRNFFFNQVKDMKTIFQGKFEEVNKIMNMYYLVRRHVAFAELC